MSEVEKITVTVNDEANNRSLRLNLTQDEFERAARDSVYLGQLIDNYDNMNVFSQADVDASENSSLYIWSDACIQLLLTLYDENKENFETKRHKKVFDNIAEKMKEFNPNYTMSGGQCQSKINSLKKTYKKILDHNSKSGNDRATWPYFDRMHEIFGASAWANPVATASEAGPSDTQSSAHSIKRKRLEKSDDILEDFFKEKKKHMAEKILFKRECLKIKQQQHKERMEILQSLCNIMSNNNNK